MAKRARAQQSFDLSVELMNDAQRNAWRTVKESEVTFLVGPPGTAKTHVAMAYAATALIRNEIEFIYITRPAVETEEHLGFLPAA